MEKAEKAEVGKSSDAHADSASAAPILGFLSEPVVFRYI